MEAPVCIKFSGCPGLAGLAGLADVSCLFGKSIALAIAEKPPRLNRDFLKKQWFVRKTVKPGQTGTNRAGSDRGSALGLY